MEPKIVDELLRRLGVSHLLVKQQLGPIVVYMLNRNSISRRCLYERCSTLDPVSRSKCMEECTLEVEKTIAYSIAQEIENAVRSSKVGGVGYA